MRGEHATDRRVLRVSGEDRAAFLQGLVSNDLRRLAEGPIYAALLTPQGKYISDFLLLDQGDAILMDIHADRAEDLLRRLQMYRLRRKVEIAATDLAVLRGLGTPPPDAVWDPRHAALGWRRYVTEDEAKNADPPGIDWDGIRVANCIPETGVELIPDQSFILECGFERLKGVDHRKGCYVGQEVTARMKHKTELRKGLVTVQVEGAAAPGDTITADGKPAGTLHTRAGDRAIAYLRFDRAGGELRAGDATVRWADAETVS